MIFLRSSMEPILSNVAVTAARSAFLSKYVVFPQRERQKVVTKYGYRVLNSLVLIILIILINNIVVAIKITARLNAGQI